MSISDALRTGSPQGDQLEGWGPGRGMVGQASTSQQSLALEIYKRGMWGRGGWGGQMSNFSQKASGGGDFPQVRQVRHDQCHKKNKVSCYPSPRVLF